MVQLLCASCSRPLTRECRWGSDHDYDISVPDGEPPMAPGLLIRLDKADVAMSAQGDWVGTHVYSPAGAVAANPEDVVRDNLRSAGIDDGCCGSNGGNGPNRACACGAVLGTEWSDCWTQAEVRFNPDAISIAG